MPKLHAMVALATAARQDERGFTLIELLVVLLIVGVLSAIALLSLAGPSHKAYDAAAKQIDVSAMTVAEAIATDHDGNYGEGATSYVTPEAIHEYETSIPITSAQASGGAWLMEAEAIENGHGFRIVSIAPETHGEKFTVTRLPNGDVIRTCAPQSTPFGCAHETW
jgi:type IV pilus assembly protein PilA